LTGTGACITGYVYSATKCVICDANCKKCTTKGAAKCDAD
jgi:hypothetical protein